jgi:Nup133 N terminal like
MAPSSSSPSSAGAAIDARLADFWMDDFACLRQIGRAVNAALRSDESGADLYHSISGRGGIGSSAAAAPVVAGNSSTPSSSDLYFERGVVGGVGTADSRGTNGYHPPPPPLAGLGSCARVLRHTRSLPLPAVLQGELGRVKVNSRMGLLPGGPNLAYLTVDDRLFLWSYHLPRTSSSAAAPSSSSNSDFCSFDVPSKQCIVSVGLVRPKKGEFFAPSCV